MTPTRSCRRPRTRARRGARRYAADRFPALAQAPLKESKSCRYELSPDSRFIAAPHPEHPSVWIVGGGSGHGFKHGPAMAERIVNAWDGGEPLPARFGLGKRERGHVTAQRRLELANEPRAVIEHLAAAEFGRQARRQ